MDLESISLTARTECLAHEQNTYKIHTVVCVERIFARQTRQTRIGLVTNTTMNKPGLLPCLATLPCCPPSRPPDAASVIFGDMFALHPFSFQ